MIKTLHNDRDGDTIAIYMGQHSNLIFIDGLFDDSDVAFRGIYTPDGAREIANRLNQLADLLEGK